MADATTTADDLAIDADEATPGAPLPEFFEIIDGEVVEIPPMGINEIAIANELKQFLDAYLRDQPLGRFYIETLHDLRPVVDRNRRPDAAFVSFERWPKDKPFPRGNAWPVVPEIAVEVVSPHDDAIELITKIHEYFRAGARLAWVVFQPVAQVYVYESTTSIRVLGRGDALEGGDVLPGFRVPLAELFGPEQAPGA